MIDEIMKLMHEINDPLIERGRFIAPILVQNQFAMVVKDLCTELAFESDDQEARQLLTEIDHLVSIHWFSPLMRSWQCHRASEIPFVQNFSHMIERATFHYFRQDYLSSIMVLVPVIEGIILRHSSTPISDFKKWSALKGFLDALVTEYRQPEMVTRFENYRNFLTTFLDKRFFCGGKTASQSFHDSVLNRNFILHMLGDEPFYNQHDCQTLFQLIDLYMEVIVCQKQGTDFHCWIKPELGDVLPRERHYWSIILNNYLGIGDHQAEESLLKTHTLYKEIPASTNYIEIQGAGPPELTALTKALMQAPEFLVRAILSMPKLDEHKQQVLTTACEAVVLVKGISEKDLVISK